MPVPKGGVPGQSHIYYIGVGPGFRTTLKDIHGVPCTFLNSYQAGVYAATQLSTSVLWEVKQFPPEKRDIYLGSPSKSSRPVE